MMEEDLHSSSLKARTGWSSQSFVKRFWKKWSCCFCGGFFLKRQWVKIQVCSEERKTTRSLNASVLLLSNMKVWVLSIKRKSNGTTFNIFCWVLSCFCFWNPSRREKKRKIKRRHMFSLASGSSGSVCCSQVHLMKRMKRGRVCRELRVKLTAGRGAEKQQ